MRIKQNEVYLRACVTSIFGVFHAMRGPYLFTIIIIIIFRGVPKKMPPRFLDDQGYLWTKYQEF